MTLSELVQQKIDELVAEYQGKGYAVLVHPPADQLPDFLRAFEPVLVETSPRDNVVVEVKTPSTNDAGQLTRLAKAVESQPGWHLEFVFVNQPVAAEIPAEEQLAPEAQVNRLLSSAEALFADGEVEAAAMLAWSAAETILRRSAQSAAPELERQSSARVSSICTGSAGSSPRRTRSSCDSCNSATRLHTASSRVRRHRQFPTSSPTSGACSTRLDVTLIRRRRSSATMAPFR